MKKRFYPTLALLAFIATSCNDGGYQSSVVKETYLHKYGVPVSKDEWNQQGQEGQVVQVLRTGVTATLSYEKGVLEGESTFTFPNSSVVQKSEFYRRGHLIAKRMHYSNGLPKTEEKYEGELLKEKRTWFEEGSPQLIESYQQGALTTGEYRNQNNEIESKVEHGFGTRLIRNSLGEVIAHETIEQGELVERCDFYPSGETKAITPYKNLNVHGTRLTFSPGGLPLTAEEWRYGVQEGQTIFYENGEKVAEVPYIRGKKEGLERRYREGNILAEELTWKQGVQHGPRTLLIDSEKQVDWYHNGELVSRPTYERLNPPSTRHS